MLVKVIDHKGKERFVNATYIKSLTPKGTNQTDIEVSGWATKVRVNQPSDEVAQIVNAAMPNNLDTLLGVESEQQTQNDAAMLIAVIG